MNSQLTPSGKEIGQCLRELRVVRDLEPAEVACRSGLGVEVIDDIEAGRGDPSAKALVKVAGALGVSMAMVCRLIETDSQLR